MAGQVSLASEAVLKQLFHQRFGISQRHQAAAQIARRHDAQILAQSSGRAPVISHRDNRRQIARPHLESTQQGGKTRAAANHDDRRTAVQAALLVDDINQPVSPSRRHHLDNRADDATHRVAHHRQTERQHHRADQSRHPAVIGPGCPIDKTEQSAFHRTDKLVVEQQCQTEAGGHDPAGKQEKPSLDPHPRIEPLQQSHITQLPCCA